jgi:FdhD protein
MVFNNSSINKNNIQNINKKEKYYAFKKENAAKNKDVFEQKNIVLYKSGNRLEKEDLIIKEFPLTIFINKYELLTLMVLKENLEYLVIGFLAAEGLIKKRSEIVKLEFKQNDSVVMVELESDFKPGRFKKIFEFRRM